jgi:ubiquitin thioesterase protein OTUB1
MIILAMAFAYLEALIRAGDKSKFMVEEVRLKSMQNILDAAGFQQDVWEDFAEELWDLMRRIAGSLHSPADAQSSADTKSILLTAFNNIGLQASIIAYLRFLTSSYMQTHAEDFQPFLMGEDVPSFCQRTIIPFNHEIENLGITALSEFLLKPAGLSLEILYLDRSAGDEVNEHTFPAEYPSGTLRLLYRP